MVVDGFRALHSFADGEADYRRFLNQLAGRLGAFPAASLWLGVYQASDVPLRPEFAVADAILDLEIVRTGQRDMRFLEVRKLRGSGFRTGQHAYRLGPHGLRVFPRLADPPADDRSRAAAGRVPFGIPGLDEMLGGGLFPGAATMIAGPACGEDGPGPALHLRRRRPRRARDHRHLPGEPGPAAADVHDVRLAGR